MRRAEGVITVYASLTMILLLSLAGALIQSAAIQTSKNRAKAAAFLAVESVFAEYDPDLQKRYHVFAADCGRGGGDSESYALGRMSFYGADTQDASFRRVQYLSDSSGEALYEQALLYMEQAGIDISTRDAARLKEEADRILADEEQAGENARAMNRRIREYAGKLEEAGEQPAEEETPAPERQGAEENEKWKELLSAFSAFSAADLPESVMPQGKSVSGEKIDLSLTASHRTLQKGKGSFRHPVSALAGSAAGTAVFDSYLMEVTADAVSEPEEETALRYETEYILFGEESDKENLKKAASRLLLIRTALNTASLKSDAGRQAEIAAAAAFLSLSMGMPGAEGGIAQALTYAWAYGESVMEVRALLAGKKVPAVKSPENWKLSIGGLIVMAGSPFGVPGQDVSAWEAPSEEGGMDYEDYLRIFLAAETKGVKTMRAVDLIELNIDRMRSLGGSRFKADQSICRLDVKSSCRLERGIRYSFATAFAYR